MNINYSRPDCFYKKQDDIYNCTSRFTYTMSGNKTGKTFSHAIWINEQCILGPHGTEYAWLAPFFRTAEIAFNLLKRLIMESALYQYLDEKGSKNTFHFNNSKMRITYPNGNILNFYSGENIHALYGFEIHAAVVDEASRMKEEAFDALLSTMFVTEGPVKLVSNPTIKNNWFFKKWKKVYNMPNHRDEDEASFKLTALDAIEAGIMPQSVFDFAKKNYITAVFRRDFLAEVPDTETSVFQYDKVHENILSEEDKVENSLNKVRYLGIDLGFTTGQKNDFTVVTGLDKNGIVRFFKRFKASGQDLIDKLKAYIGDKPSFIDKTGGGITIYELLKNDCKNLEPYNFTNSSKTLCVENLAHYIHGNKIKYNNIKILIEELIGYEIDFTNKGKPTYSNGKTTDHDDSVISLALATLKLKEESEGNNCTFNIYNLDNESDNIDWEGEGREFIPDMPDFSFTL